MTVSEENAFEGFETFRNVVFPWHCDSMGHMNTQFFAAAFDAAQIGTLNRIARATSLAERRLGWADVRQVFEYRHEVLANAVIVIRSKLTRLGTSSLVVLHTLAEDTEATICATCETTTVLFDLERRKAVSIEGELRDRAQELLET